MRRTDDSLQEGGRGGGGIYMLTEQTTQTDTSVIFLIQTNTHKTKTDHFIHVLYKHTCNAERDSKTNLNRCTDVSKGQSSNNIFTVLCIKELVMD